MSQGGGWSGQWWWGALHIAQLQNGSSLKRVNGWSSEKSKLFSRTQLVTEPGQIAMLLLQFCSEVVVL
eukprot:1148239-Amphidinium_carterae.1